MGWFLRCLCFKPHNRRRFSSQNRRDHLVSRSRIASLPLPEEKEGSLYKENGNPRLESGHQASKEKELVEKKLVEKDPWVPQNQLASLLHAGDSEEKRGSPGKDNVRQEIEFPSYVNNEKELVNEVPVSPVKQCEELGKEAGSLEHKPFESNQAPVSHVNSSCEELEMKSGSPEHKPSSTSVEEKSEDKDSTRFPETNGFHSSDEPRKTPVHITDRPIFGTVGLYWNYDDL